MWQKDIRQKSNMTDRKWKTPVSFVHQLPQLSLPKHVLWLSLPQQLDIGSVSLTSELEYFSEYVKLDEKEEWCRASLLKDLRVIAYDQFPHAHVNAFGSFPVGLSTYMSDLDVTVVFCEAIAASDSTLFFDSSHSASTYTSTSELDSMSELSGPSLLEKRTLSHQPSPQKFQKQSHLHNHHETNHHNRPLYNEALVASQSSAMLSSYEIEEARVQNIFNLETLYASLQETPWVRRIEFRKHARVPIIHLHHSSGVECDLSADLPQHATSAVVRGFIHRCGPAIFKLSAFLKIYLHQLGLDAPYTGGLGSYKLYVLIAKHIELNPKFIANVDSPDLGPLLLSFLQHYGHRYFLNASTVVQVGGAEAATFERTSKVCEIQQAFHAAYCALMSVGSGSSDKKYVGKEVASGSALAGLLNTEVLCKDRMQRRGLCHQYYNTYANTMASSSLADLSDHYTASNSNYANYSTDDGTTTNSSYMYGSANDPSNPSNMYLDLTTSGRRTAPSNTHDVIDMASGTSSPTENYLSSTGDNNHHTNANTTATTLSTSTSSDNLPLHEHLSQLKSRLLARKIQREASQSVLAHISDSGINGRNSSGGGSSGSSGGGVELGSTVTTQCGDTSSISNTTVTNSIYPVYSTTAENTTTMTSTQTTTTTDTINSPDHTTDMYTFDPQSVAGQSIISGEYNMPLDMIVRAQDKVFLPDHLQRRLGPFRNLRIGDKYTAKSLIELECMQREQRERVARLRAKLHIPTTTSTISTTSTKATTTPSMTRPPLVFSPLHDYCKLILEGGVPVPPYMKITDKQRQLIEEAQHNREGLEELIVQRRQDSGSGGGDEETIVGGSGSDDNDTMCGGGSNSGDVNEVLAPSVPAIPKTPRRNKKGRKISGRRGRGGSKKGSKGSAETPLRSINTATTTTSSKLQRYLEEVAVELPLNTEECSEEVLSAETIRKEDEIAEEARSIESYSDWEMACEGFEPESPQAACTMAAPTTPASVARYAVNAITYATTSNIRNIHTSFGSCSPVNSEGTDDGNVGWTIDRTAANESSTTHASVDVVESRADLSTTKVVVDTTSNTTTAITTVRRDVRTYATALATTLPTPHTSLLQEVPPILRGLVPHSWGRVQLIREPSKNCDIGSLQCGEGRVIDIKSEFPAENIIDIIDLTGDDNHTGTTSTNTNTAIHTTTHTTTNTTTNTTANTKTKTNVNKVVARHSTIYLPNVPTTCATISTTSSTSTPITKPTSSTSTLATTTFTIGSRPTASVVRVTKQGPRSVTPLECNNVSDGSSSDGIGGGSSGRVVTIGVEPVRKSRFSDNNDSSNNDPSRAEARGSIGTGQMISSSIVPASARTCTVPMNISSILQRIRGNSGGGNGSINQQTVQYARHPNVMYVPAHLAHLYVQQTQYTGYTQYVQPQLAFPRYPEVPLITQAGQQYSLQYTTHPHYSNTNSYANEYNTQHAHNANPVREVVDASITYRAAPVPLPPLPPPPPLPIPAPEPVVPGYDDCRGPVANNTIASVEYGSANVTNYQIGQPPPPLPPLQDVPPPPSMQYIQPPQLIVPTVTVHPSTTCTTQTLEPPLPTLPHERYTPPPPPHAQLDYTDSYTTDPYYSHYAYVYPIDTLITPHFTQNNAHIPTQAGSSSYSSGYGPYSQAPPGSGQGWY